MPMESLYLSQTKIKYSFTRNLKSSLFIIIRINGEMVNQTDKYSGKSEIGIKSITFVDKFRPYIVRLIFL
jgi:hypothetical protein